MSISREIRKMMQREKDKGSCPLELISMEFGDYSYHQVHSQDELTEAMDYLLRLGKFKYYEEKTIMNNVYMDYDIFKGQMWMKRTRSAFEREELKVKMSIRAKRFQLDYCGGKVITETARCHFGFKDDDLMKYKMKYRNQDTYAFPMSDAYLKGLYLQCEDARRNVPEDIILKANLSEELNQIIRLNSVKDGLFKALLLDDLVYENGLFTGNFRSILLLK